MFCASRHSIISIALFRQRLNVEEMRTGALVTEFGAIKKTFRGVLNCSFIFILFLHAKKVEKEITIC